MTTFYTSDENREHALALCGRSDTKRALLENGLRWSLSDLRGRAKQYVYSYAKQRDALLRDLRAEGLDPVDVRLPSMRGERVVIL